MSSHLRAVLKHLGKHPRRRRRRSKRSWRASGERGNNGPYRLPNSMRVAHSRVESTVRPPSIGLFGRYRIINERDRLASFTIKVRFSGNGAASTVGAAGGGGTDLCFFMDARARAPEAPDASSFLHEGFELL
jgi:hypothetical protein